MNAEAALAYALKSARSAGSYGVISVPINQPSAHARTIIVVLIEIAVASDPIRMEHVANAVSIAVAALHARMSLLFKAQRTLRSRL